jgi:hypothetical protein
MLGIPLRYLLKHPVTGIADVVADPIEILNIIRDAHASDLEGRRPQCRYEPDLSWEQQLHEALGVPWPCDEAPEFMELWHRVVSELEEKGIRAGPESFQWWNDGDAGLVRAIWCLTRHLRPKNVVETGVAHGVTSRFILEALKRNGDGHLWSIDLPPLDRSWHQQIGIAVGAGHSDRWTYIKGSSRRRLPRLLYDLGQIDLFIHDSLHTERNVRFELDRTWPMLGPKGAIVVDDIDANWGFRSFSQTIPDQVSLICEAEPLRPDLRRFNKKGLFGIILKTPTATGLRPSSN